MIKTISAIENFVDGEVLQALGDIAKELDNLKIPFFVIGAFARDIIAASFGEGPSRKTRDLDLAIMVNTEKHFLDIKSRLAAKGSYQEDPKQEQRIIYRAAIKIDLVPFGRIAQNGEVPMPPSRAFVMSVHGFDEAYKGSQQIEITSGLSCRVVSVEDLICLKFVAWNDRPNERSRDAEDIDYLLRRYSAFTPEIVDDVYSNYQEVLKEYEFDIDLACIHVMGEKMAKRSSPETLAKIRFTQNESTLNKFLSAALGGNRVSDEGSTAKIETRLAAFFKGIGKND